MHLSIEKKKREREQEPCMREKKKKKTCLLASDISVDQNAVACIRTSTFEKSSTGSFPSDNDNDG